VSGIVTQATETRPTPIESASVYRVDEEEQLERADFPIHGDMRFDVQLVRR
jgi:hypothetical protein